MSEIPFVSVIIPMYNAEKYIGELLDSLLAQTMKNFEVIVVDDCSKDKSYEIVESYLPRFSGRLQLIKLPKNSESVSMPRNRGLEMSIGKYIFFADNDDVLIDNALEKLYNIAETFKTDVIHCERHFSSHGIGEDFKKNIKIENGKSSVNITNHYFMTEDFVERVNIWLNFQFGVMPWLYFSSRKFLIETGIKFRKLWREDVFWSLEMLFSSKNILRVIEPYYINRMRADSTTNNNKTLDRYFGYWMDRTVNGLKLLEDFLLKIPFFKENPNYRYEIINHWAMGDIQLATNTCRNLPPFVIKDVFQEVFSKDLGDKDTLVSYLFANSIMLTRNLMLANQRIAQLSTSTQHTDS